MSGDILPFPQELRPRRPAIVGNVDYQTLRLRLEQIDTLLRQSSVEREFVQRSRQPWTAARKGQASVRAQLKHQQRSRRALRCTLLRTLLQEDYRGFSCQPAGHPLYQWFCLLATLEQVRVPSKSELQRFAHWLPAEPMRAILEGLLRAAVEPPGPLGLNEALDLDEYFVDSTCLKADIHFPTDRVWLRDGVRTLMKATRLIRQAGLRGRMEGPEVFLRRMNRLSLAMTQPARRAGGRKGRKRVLRQMKQLVGVVQKHARRHRVLLDKDWEQTAWTRPQAEAVLRRIDNVLELLPQARRQAHERIIGGRQVPNADKILSLYEPDVRVIVRGRAGAEVEFGNTVVLGENRPGVILDYELFQESAPADSQTLCASWMRVWEGPGRRVQAVVTDRGFAGASNSKALAQAGTFDGRCPRQPAVLRERMQDPRFARLQRRRAQTEGRISILKRGFLGRPMRARGFAQRQPALAWGVLTHNLWLFARLSKARPEALRQAA